MAALPRISVIIVSYNVCTLLARNLAALTNAFEVIVVDNASSDGSAEMVRTRFAWARLIASTTNDGFGVAINRGRKLAKGDALLLLNPDAELGPEALSQMQQRLVKQPAISAFGFRQVDQDGNFQLACGLRPTLATEAIRRLVQKRLDAKSYRLGRLVDRVLGNSRDISWVAASCLLVRLSAFDAVGGFDERYFLFFEDIDFCLRLRARGFSLRYDGLITLTHVRGASAKTRPEAAERAYRDSQRLFFQTWGGPVMRHLAPWWAQRSGSKRMGCA